MFIFLFASDLLSASLVFSSFFSTTPPTRYPYLHPLFFLSEGQMRLGLAHLPTVALRMDRFPAGEL